MVSGQINILFGYEELKLSKTPNETTKENELQIKMQALVYKIKSIESKMTDIEPHFFLQLNKENNDL